MAVKYGVFLARMQPVHNAHLFMVNKVTQSKEKIMEIISLNIIH